MKLFFPVLPLAALGLFVASNTGTVPAKAAVLDGVYNGADLTTAELAGALNVRWWDLKIPEDVNPDAVVGIAFYNEKGILRRTGGSTGWKPNSRVKVFLMGLDEEKLRYAFIGSGHDTNGTIRNKLFDLGDSPATSFIGNGSTISPNQILVRRGQELYAHDSQLRVGEIGIAVIAEPLH